jgi:hypothetical protein
MDRRFASASTHLNNLNLEKATLSQDVFYSKQYTPTKPICIKIAGTG